MAFWATSCDFVIPVAVRTATGTTQWHPENIGVAPVARNRGADGHGSIEHWMAQVAAGYLCGEASGGCVFAFMPDKPGFGFP